MGYQRQNPSPHPENSYSELPGCCPSGRPHEVVQVRELAFVFQFVVFQIQEMLLHFEKCRREYLLALWDVERYIHVNTMYKYHT